MVAVHCHFVHVASNKKSFSKVKKKSKKKLPCCCYYSRCYYSRCYYSRYHRFDTLGGCWHVAAAVSAAVAVAVADGGDDVGVSIVINR